MLRMVAAAFVVITNPNFFVSLSSASSAASNSSRQSSKKKKTFVLYQRLFSSSLYTYTSNGMRFIIYAKKIKKKMLFY